MHLPLLLGLAFLIICQLIRRRLPETQERTMSCCLKHVCNNKPAIERIENDILSIDIVNKKE